MPRYVRAFYPGGTFFFTVALLERRRRLLTEHIDTLRDVMRGVQLRRPYRIDAIAKANGKSGSAGSGNTSFATSGTSSVMRITFTTMRSSMAMCSTSRNGRIRAFTGMSNEASIRATGVARWMSLTWLWNDAIVGIRCAFPTYLI